MKHRFFAIGILASLTAYSSNAQDEVSFTTSDGVQVFGYWQSSNLEHDGTIPTVLLFHMARASALGEYQETADRLNAEGYNTLAVDLRSGSNRLGAPNKTSSGLSRSDYSYCEGYPDLVAALDWVAARQSGPVIAVGSSFSAALSIQLAADFPEKLTAVAAFSPASGEPMAGCRPENVLSRIDIPIVAFRPDREMGIESVQAQSRVFEGHSIPYVEIENGRHGSLMLRESVTGTSMEHAWQPFLEFLVQSLSSRD